MAFPDDGVVLICGRVGDLQCSPVEGSIQLQCCDCGCKVMVSPTSQAKHSSGVPIVCVQCFARHRDEGNAVILVRQD